VSKQLTQFNLHSTLVGKYWKPEYGLMLKKAAEYSQTERIFISPPIKKALCQAFKPKTPAEKYPEWLRKVSPYHGHDSHLHVRLSCPKDAEACKAQGVVKSDPKDQTGVGCAGPTYNYWLDDSGKPGTLMAEEIEEFKKTNKLYSPAAEKEASSKALLDKLSKLPAACQALIGWNPQGKSAEPETTQ
jgi:murein endopeptidase